MKVIFLDLFITADIYLFVKSTWQFLNTECLKRVSWPLLMTNQETVEYSFKNMKIAWDFRYIN